jgi:hypothetical protein
VEECGERGRELAVSRCYTAHPEQRCCALLLVLDTDWVLPEHNATIPVRDFVAFGFAANFATSCVIGPESVVAPEQRWATNRKRQNAWRRGLFETAKCIAKAECL